MEIQKGFAYHIKDEYFEVAKDKNLMQNKEKGSYRPTLYCMKDESTGLLWMIPISSQYEKFAAIREKIISKGKVCRGIVLGEFDGHDAAFLIQNMFPVTERYIDHIVSVRITLCDARLRPSHALRQLFIPYIIEQVAKVIVAMRM